MDSSKDGGPAFPCDPNAVIYTGVSVRDYFAARVIQGLLACENSVYITKEEIAAGKTWPDRVAEDGYSIADAMLKRRER